MSEEIAVGSKVIVCGELETTITKIEGDEYYFLDSDGKEWKETTDAIELIVTI